MDQRVPMTPRGFEALKQELKQIISVERPENIKDIEEAIAHGDSQSSRVDGRAIGDIDLPGGSTIGAVVRGAARALVEAA